MYDGHFKIIILGDDSIEKTSFTKRYCYNLFNPSERLTIEVDFHVKTIELHGKKIKLQIWDVGGEERFRFLLPTYCLGANAALFLYNITNPGTLEHLPDWTRIVREKSGDIPIILVGAKAHLEQFRAVSREEGILAAKKYNLSGFIEVSSKTGYNVEKAFEALTSLMLEGLGHQRRIKKEAKDKTVGLSEEEKEKIKEKILKISVPESLERQNLNLGHKLYGELDRFLELERLTKEQKLLIDNLISNIQKNPSKKKIYLRLFLDRFPDLSNQDKKDIIQSIEDEWDGKIDDDDYIPFPYIFNPPKPPDDFAMAPRVQLHTSPKKKDPEEKIPCQYCGRELTKEEQFTHSCKKKPKNK